MNWYRSRQNGIFQWIEQCFRTFSFSFSLSCCALYIYIAFARRWCVVKTGYTRLFPSDVCCLSDIVWVDTVSHWPLHYYHCACTSTLLRLCNLVFFFFLFLSFIPIVNWLLFNGLQNKAIISNRLRILAAPVLLCLSPFLPHCKHTHTCDQSTFRSILLHSHICRERWEMGLFHHQNLNSHIWPLTSFLMRQVYAYF